MKNRILTFIIGVLAGAILATAGFLVYNKSTNQNPNQRFKQMEGYRQMQRPDGTMENPPAKPEIEFQQKMQNNI